MLICPRCGSRNINTLICGNCGFEFVNESLTLLSGADKAEHTKTTAFSLFLGDTAQAANGQRLISCVRDGSPISSVCKKRAAGACPPERRKSGAFIGSKVFNFVHVFRPEGGMLNGENPYESAEVAERTRRLSRKQLREYGLDIAQSIDVTRMQTRIRVSDR